VSATVRKKREARKKRLLQERQRRILKRLANSPEGERPMPMMTASNIHYELADRVQGLSAGGIGAMLLLARRTGLIGDIDANLHLLKVGIPGTPYVFPPLGTDSGFRGHHTDSGDTTDSEDTIRNAGDSGTPYVIPPLELSMASPEPP
jgi:hypothetical protein